MDDIFTILPEIPTLASITFIVSGYQCPDTGISMDDIFTILPEIPTPASITFIVSGY